MTELRFVSPEEAAKWPEGTPILIAKGSKKPRYEASYRDFLRQCIATGYTHFARLPDSLPEVERNG